MTALDRFYRTPGDALADAVSFKPAKTSAIAHGIASFQKSMSRRSEWAGAPSLAAAVKLAETGLDATVATFGIDDALVGRGNALRVTHDVAGGSVDVGRYLQGVPDSMMRTVQRPSPLMVRIGVGAGVNSNISAPYLYARGLRVLTAIRSIEETGARVSLDVSYFTTGNAHTCHVCIRVKGFGDVIDPQTVAHWLVQPSAYRWVGFMLWRRLMGTDAIYADFGNDMLGHGRDVHDADTRWDVYLPIPRHEGQDEQDAQVLAREVLKAARSRKQNAFD